jgi:hypothetical protein
LILFAFIIFSCLIIAADIIDAIISWYAISHYATLMPLLRHYFSLTLSLAAIDMPLMLMTCWHYAIIERWLLPLLLHYCHWLRHSHYYWYIFHYWYFHYCHYWLDYWCHYITLTLLPWYYFRHYIIYIHYWLFSFRHYWCH